MDFKIYAKGFKDGIPIALGYFAVAFGLGIAAHNAGITAIQGFIMSAFNMASAGQYAGIASIRAMAPFWQLALLILITNARYLLMSAALSQKLSPGLSLKHRLVIGFSITDELFGIGIAYPTPIAPEYLYGAYSIAIPGWATGTALGIIAGNLLPVMVVNALSAAIFGMFIAVVIPPGRKDKMLLALVLISFAISTVVSFIPAFMQINESMRIIILTLVISCAAAIIKPVQDDKNDQEVA